MPRKTMPLVPVEGVSRQISSRETTGIPCLRDEHYRYMMPLLDTRLTAHALELVNLREVARACEVPPEWMAKYIGVECGARCKYSSKDGSCKLSVGHSSNRDAAGRAARAQELVRAFIDLWVLCPGPTCHNPEFSLLLATDGSGDLHSHCPACGFTGPVVDQSHKVSRFICKELKAEAKRARKEGRRAGGKFAIAAAPAPDVGDEAKEPSAAAAAAAAAAPAASAEDDSSSGDGGRRAKGRKKKDKRKKAKKKSSKKKSRHGTKSPSAGGTGAGGAGAGYDSDPEYAALVASFGTGMTSQLGDDWE